MSCADWVEDSTGKKLTAFQRLAVETLVAGLQTGPWNIPTKWKSVEWDYGSGVKFNVYGTLSTYDFDKLTRLVIAAHDNCVRVQIEAVAPRYLAIAIHPRQRDGKNMATRHPTIEAAIADFRKRGAAS